MFILLGGRKLMSRQQINGNNNIQATGDVVITKNDIVSVKRDLSVSVVPIRNDLVDNTSLDQNDDVDNTVLITKLKNGGFNLAFQNSAKRRKLDALKLVLQFSKKETGKKILNDIYENLLTIINIKYISQLSDGESLKSNMKDMFEDLSAVVDKYKGQIDIDEAFLEGLLYIATSRCALKWKVEEDA